MSRARVSLGAIGAIALGWAGAASAQDAAPAAAGAPPHASPDRFAIEAYDVSGVTRFDADQLAEIVYPFAGPDKSSADVEAARKALQDAYAKRGFEAVVVDIPVQPPETFSRGIVQLTVNETPLGQVIVSGGKYHSADRVRAQVPSLVPGQPIDLAALQRDVAAANRFPDRTITPTFKPSPTSGAVDVELKVKDELPLHASVEVNNDNSPSTTRLRVASSFRYTNLGGTGQTLSGTYIFAPERKKDSEVISGSYSVPLIGTPWTFLAYGYKSNSDIAALGGSNVLGNGVQIGVRAVYKLPADKTYQSVSIGPDFKDFKQDITVGGKPAGSAPIRYVPIVAEYSLSGATETASYDFTLGMTAGLRAIKRTTCVVVVTGLPCVPVDQFRNREIDSNENFVHLNFQGNYARTFAGDFVAAYRANAQISDSHLITNEQYSIGGLTNVRGYYQSEAVGDDGFTQSFEFRAPSAASLFGSVVDELRVYAFADLGYAHVRSALPEQKSDFRLVGVGGGARVRLFQMWSGELSIGVPLLDGPVSDAGDPRAVFVVRGEF